MVWFALFAEAELLLDHGRERGRISPSGCWPFEKYGTPWGCKARRVGIDWPWTARRSILLSGR